jgi:hypothetical protein
LQPQPFAPQRSEAVARLEAALASSQGASIVWLADGIDHDGAARGFADQLARLAQTGLSVIVSGTGEEPLGLLAGLGSGGKLEATVLRTGGGPRDGVIHAYSLRSQRLGEAPFRLAAGAASAAASFELPLELRNQVTRVEIASERSAGAVQLLDASSQWNRIGLLSGESREQAQPLLAPLYYIQKALAPFAEIVQPRDSNLAQGIDTVIKQNATVMILADIGTLEGEMKTRVDEWVRKGGVLVRFAGHRLEKGGDDLLPAPLRIGGRTLGGATVVQKLSTILGVTRTRDLHACRGGQKVMVAGVKVASQTPAIRSGQRIIFLTLDDATGPIEVTVFESVQPKVAKTVFHSYAMAVWGQLRRTGVKGVSIIAEEVWDLTALHRARGEGRLREAMEAPTEPALPARRLWHSSPGSAG